MQSLGMIAHRNKQGGGTIGADAVGLPEARTGQLDELVEIVQQLSDLLLKA